MRESFVCWGKELGTQISYFKQSAFVWISSIWWVFTRYLIGREFWNIFENYWVRCFSSKKKSLLLAIALHRVIYGNSLNELIQTILVYLRLCFQKDLNHKNNYYSYNDLRFSSWLARKIWIYVNFTFKYWLAFKKQLSYWKHLWRFNTEMRFLIVV